MAELARLTAIEPSHTKLPSYEEIQAERELKETFAHLEKDHEDLQELFKKVATQLETTPQIGEDHELTKEWDQMFKVRSAYAYSLTVRSGVNADQYNPEAQEAVQGFAAECKPVR